MDEIHEVRRERFREVMRSRFNNSQTEIAKRLEIDANYISRILSLPSKKGHKRISGDYAREIEPKLGVPRGFLDGEAVTGVREESPPAPINRLKIHDVYCSRDGALVGAEWDKIEGDEYRQLAKDFIYGLVTAQKNAARRPGKVLTTRPRGPKTKDHLHKRHDA
jgi:hypothetical protein